MPTIPSRIPMLGSNASQTAAPKTPMSRANPRITNALRMRFARICSCRLTTG